MPRKAKKVKDLKPGDSMVTTKTVASVTHTDTTSTVEWNDGSSEVFDLAANPAIPDVEDGTWPP